MELSKAFKCLIAAVFCAAILALTNWAAYSIYEYIPPTQPSNGTENITPFEVMVLLCQVVLSVLGLAGFAFSVIEFIVEMTENY